MSSESDVAAQRGHRTVSPPPQTPLPIAAVTYAAVVKSSSSRSSSSSSGSAELGAPPRSRSGKISPTPPPPPPGSFLFAAAAPLDAPDDSQPSFPRAHSADGGLVATPRKKSPGGRSLGATKSPTGTKAGGSENSSKVLGLRFEGRLHTPLVLASRLVGAQQFFHNVDFGPVGELDFAMIMTRNTSIYELIPPGFLYFESNLRSSSDSCTSSPAPSPCDGWKSGGSAPKDLDRVSTADRESLPFEVPIGAAVVFEVQTGFADLSSQKTYFPDRFANKAPAICRFCEEHRLENLVYVVLCNGCEPKFDAARFIKEQLCKKREDLARIQVFLAWGSHEQLQGGSWERSLWLRAEAADRAKQSELTEARQDAAEAQRDAAEARKRADRLAAMAEEAQRDAAEAQRDAAEARKRADRLAAMAEEAQRDAAEAQRDAAEARRDAAEARKDAADVAARLSQLENRWCLLQ